MIYSFEVTEGEFGFTARLQGDEKDLSGVGETVWEAIEHLASFINNMRSVEQHPENFIGGGITHDYVY